MLLRPRPRAHLLGAALMAGKMRRDTRTLLVYDPSLLSRVRVTPGRLFLRRMKPKLTAQHTVFLH